MPRGRKPKNVDPNAPVPDTETVAPVFNLAVQLRRILQNEKVPHIAECKIATEPYTTNKTLYVRLDNGKGHRVNGLVAFCHLVLATHGYTITAPNMATPSTESEATEQ